MATVDRIEPAYTPWSPSASGFNADVALSEDAVEVYTGRHRRPGARRLGLLRMFYSGKHRRA